MAKNEKPIIGIDLGIDPEYLEEVVRQTVCAGIAEAAGMGHSRHHRRRHTKRKRRMCTQKAAFYSELAAMRVGARYGQDWYRCPYCHAWHLTSKNSQPGERHG